MKYKKFEKEFKSNLLYAEFYLNPELLANMFCHINEGWKQDTIKMIDPNVSLGEMDVRYMRSQVNELMEDKHAMFDSVADYIHSLLDTSKVFHNSNVLISIIPTMQINPKRKLIHSSIIAVNASKEDLQYHSKESYEEFVKMDQKDPIAEPADIYFGPNVDICESPLTHREGISHFADIENHIYHALYLWCLNVSPLEINWD